MSVSSTVIGLARELEAVEERRAEILARIAAAAGNGPDPALPLIKSPARERCRAFLRANPSGVAIAVIREHLGLGDRPTRVILTALHKRGAAVIVSRGVWGPP